MRAKNPSSAGAPGLARLCLDGCLRKIAGGGPSEGLVTLAVLRRASCLWAGAGRLDDRAAWLFAVVLTALLAAPIGRRTGCAAGGLEVFESEADVGAVRELGSFAGRVGDFGFGLTKPVDAGGSAGFLTAGLAADRAPDGFPFGFGALVIVASGFVTFSVAGLAVFTAAVAEVLEEADLTEWPGVTGVFGRAGDLLDFEDDLADVDDLLVAIGAGFEIVLPVVTLLLALAGDTVLSFAVEMPLRSSPIPELPVKALPPETASELVGLPGNSLVFGSSSDVILSGFPVEVVGGLGSTASPFCPSILLFSVMGVSTANSGIVSEMSTSSFRA